MPSNFFLTLFLTAALVVVAASSCATPAKDPTSDSPKELPKPVSDTVSGYDFAGIQTLPMPKPGMICTMELKPEQAACHGAGGKTIKADKCKILCSVPIKNQSP